METVGPCPQPNRQTIELSGLDRLSPAILYTIFFYEYHFSTESYSEAEVVVERAKKALEKVLISWFPTAGRFRINKTTGKLEIDCNNEGVTMITAATNSKLEELGRLNEYKPCYEKLVSQLPKADDISKIPLVVVQITKFACVGILVGFGSSHALFDGQGAFNFLASWSHKSSGKDASDLPLPNHSRNVLLQPIYLSDSSSTYASINEQDHIVPFKIYTPYLCKPWHLMIDVGKVLLQNSAKLIEKADSNSLLCALGRKLSRHGRD
ncbi:unnamed protein product [Ilex paraguariensis]|uniref:Uncharacterized protein n=1 Tax=Ilex paraguariensis TaxID=185542 RepID=A0ABC8U0E3_9AQUA